MTLLFKLIWRDLRANPGRVAVSVFAILVSVSLIVWMMGSYDTLVKEFDNDAEAYMGSYDLCLAPEAPKGPLPPGQYPRFSDPELVARLAASPLVESVNAACQVPRLQIGCGNERGSFDEQTRDRMGIPPQSPILVGNHAVECPYDLKEGVWPDMASSSAMEGVLGSGSAKYFSAGVGTVMNVRVGTHVYDVKVVGIVKQAKATPGVIMGPGGMSGPAFSSLFVPVKVCEKITGQPFAPNLIYVQLKEGVDKKEFVDGLRQELAQASAVVADTDSIIQRLSSDRSVRSQKESAEMSVWLVLFSCVFIIFTTLSIGVSERTRRLALMRALGMSRMQIALLIVGEGLFLCIPALLGGLAAGFCLVYLLEEGSSSVPVLTWTTVLAAAVCEALGMRSTPAPDDRRTDIIQALELGTPERLIAFCQGIQMASPIDSMALPEPWDMPGYQHQVIMAAGTFVSGASIELSADAPMREPYTAFLQGGLTYSHGKLALIRTFEYMQKKGLL